MRILIASLLSVLLGAPLCAAGAEDALFRYEGREFRAGDLSTRMQQLYGSVLFDHHRAMRSLVDEMVFDLYVERQAKAAGRDTQEVGRELLTVPEPTEPQVRAFYDGNRASISQPFELVHDQIKRHLHREAILARRAELLTRIKSEGQFAFLVQPPDPPPVTIDTRGRPVRGNPSAPVTLVEFADYQCPGCRRAVSVMNQLLEQYPGEVKLVHMDFPINRSGISREVAHGAVCAQAQGRFWEYHDLAFSRQETLTHGSHRELAQAVDLDMERFARCMEDPSTRQKVQASEAEARRLGVTATPSLFVDGRPFPSNHLLRDLGDYIERTRDSRS